MTNRRIQGSAQPTSPSSSGPAGSEFEAQVGASYLLSMLVGGEPRGLPGTVIQTIALQRAAEGHPLDDVIVHTHDPSGNPATLEIQVKRSITFTASDPVFASVVAQMVEAARKPGFWDARDLSSEGIQGSWRRAVLLSLVRSESTARALRTATPSLVADNGALLNELIRVTMAV